MRVRAGRSLATTDKLFRSRPGIAYVFFGWAGRTEDPEMRRKKSAGKRMRKQSEPRELVAALASKRFEDQTKRLLGTHYTNKHGVRRGR